MSEEWFPWIIHDGGRRLIDIRSGDIVQFVILYEGKKRVFTKRMKPIDFTYSAETRGNDKLIKYRKKKAHRLKDLKRLLKTKPAPANCQN